MFSNFKIEVKLKFNKEILNSEFHSVDDISKVQLTNVAIKFRKFACKLHSRDMKNYKTV